MQITMRIIAASYRRDDVAVELYGKAQDGRSVTALYFGFKPYFDVVEPSESYVASISKDEEFVRVEDKKLWVQGVDKDVKRIYIKSPWKVPQYRENCPFRVLAADIPFHHRFIYDKDLGSCVKIEGEELKDQSATKYSTDLVIKIDEDKIENAEAFNPDLKILSFDIENAINKSDNDEYGEIFVIGYAINEGSKYEKGSIVGPERELLKKFVDFIVERDPDVITGYNIDGYDLPALQFRMKKKGVYFGIGRDGLPPTRIMGQFWRLHGRIISDTWWNVKRILHPKHETLNYVAKELLGEGKDGINRLKIEEEWENRRQEVIDYCIKDSYLTLEIYRRMRVLDRNMFMSTVTKLPLDDVTNGGTSNYVDSILIRQADRENIGVPMTSHEKKEKPIEGGYVHSIGAGLYDNVIVLDFKSMYPSMIIKYNVCFTTLDPNGAIESPTGIRFLDKSKREGLIPRILKNLMDERDGIKKQMKTVSPEEREYLDGVQNALKILMNTFYGVMASSFYRFTNIDIGSAITAFARKTITDLIGKLEKENYRVIYGDTDSVFIESGKDSTEETISDGENLGKRLSEEEKITLEFEKVMDPFFSHGAKKRYAGKIVYPEDQKGTLLVRGYEMRRTDSFDLQSDALSTVFDYILDRNVEGASNFAKNTVMKILQGDSSIPIDELVISRSVKPFSQYKEEDSLANVRVAKKLIERGETFIPGMKVSWIVTNSKKSPQEVEPYIDGVEFEGTPDWEYYAKRVEETLNRVLESLDKEVTIANKKAPQKKLTDLFSGDSEKKGESKNLTLDSF